MRMTSLVRAVLPKGRLGRAVVLLASGTVASQAIVVLASPLLTRLYTPEDFGILAVFSALLGVLGLVVCLRYEVAIPLAEDETTAVNLVALNVVTALLVSAVVGLVVWRWGDAISAWTNAEALRRWIWLLPLGLFTFGCYTTLRHWAVRRQAFGHIVRTRLSQAIGQVAAQVGLGWLIPGPVGLLVGQVVGHSAGITSLGSSFYRNERQRLGALSVNGMIRAAARFWRLPTLATGASLLSAARMLPSLFFAVIYGAQVAGWFLLAQRVVAMPMRLLGVSVGQVYLSEAPRLYRADHARMYALFMSTTGRLFAVGILSMGIVALVGPELFAMVFGDEWTETGRYARFLAPMYIAQLAVSPTGETLTIVERQDLRLAWDAVSCGTLMLIFFGAYWLGWSALHTVIVLSIGMTLCYLGLFVLTRVVLLDKLRAAADRSAP
jgi:O-antigen/teichoic acid export membrane protein